MIGQGIRLHPSRLPQAVGLFAVIFLACLDQMATTSSHYDHTRKLQQFQQVASLNSSSAFKDVYPVITKASSIRSYPIYFSVYLTSTTPTDGYFGALSTFDVYAYPNLRTGELSAASVWVKNTQQNDFNSTNSIQAGWEINPDLYGDRKTHFFINWVATDGNNSTGCSNLDCIGFVPVNGAPITPGDALEPANGHTKITLKIFKKEDDGYWWLYFGYDINKLSRVGYWPKDLFTYMADRASSIAWGGFTHSNKGKPSPPMGNGQWPGQNSASVQNIQYVDQKGHGASPSGWHNSLFALAPFIPCYRASTIVNGMFHNGGPGGCKIF